MAKLPDVLKKAVQKQDWSLVCKVYTAMTGAPLKPPKVIVPDFANMEIDISDDDFQELTKPVVKVKKNTVKKKRTPSQNKSKLDTSGDAIVAEEKEPAPRRTKRRNKSAPKNTGETQSRITQRRQHTNEFVDDLTIATKERGKDGKLISLLVSENPDAGVPTMSPRNARAEESNTGNLIEVQCILCDEWFDVSPSLAYGYREDPPNTKDENRQNTWKCNECNTQKGRIKAYRRRNE